VSPVIIEGVVDEEEGRVGAVGRTLQKITCHINSDPLAHSCRPHLLHSLSVKGTWVIALVFATVLIFVAEYLVSPVTQLLGAQDHALLLLAFLH